MTYDFGPLEKLLIDPGAHHNDGAVRAVAACLGIDRNSVPWYRKTGLTTETADRFSIRAGLHPSLVWPTWYDDAFDEPVCMWCREPARFGCTYCSRHCADLAGKDRKRQVRVLAKWWARVDRYAETVDFEALNPSGADTPGVQCGGNKVVPAQCDLPGTVASPYGRETSEMDHTPPVVGVAS